MLSGSKRSRVEKGDAPVRREDLDSKVPVGTGVLVKKQRLWYNANSNGTQKDAHGNVTGLNVTTTVDDPKDDKTVYHVPVQDMGRKCLLGNYELPFVFNQVSVKKTMYILDLFDQERFITHYVLQIKQNKKPAPGLRTSEDYPNMYEKHGPVAIKEAWTAMDEAISARKDTKSLAAVKTTGKKILSRVPKCPNISLTFPSETLSSRFCVDRQR